MRVLGIDPGLSTTGFGAVERSGGRLLAVGFGVIRTDPRAPYSARLKELREALAEVIARYEPAAVALERLFFNSNVKTAMSVGQASGIALLAAAEAGLDVADYTPSQVKSSVVGVGNATKKQVQSMVASLLRLSRAPERADAADACALAICHLNSHGYRTAVARAVGGTS
jgi:crossover junction endodeoxyribonuclease RuvC